MFCWLLLIPGFAAQWAAGQVPVTPAGECANVAERLRDGDMAEKAWGAYAAGRCHRTDLALDIVHAVEALNPEFLLHSVPSKEVWTGRAMMDALIQLHVRLPAADLELLGRGYPVEAAILMLQFPQESAEPLFDLRRRWPDSTVWIAASNALVHLRAAGLADSLLHEIQFTHTFEVNDTGKPMPRGMIGDNLGSIGSEKSPQNYPPIALYQLFANSQQNGDELISDGPMKISMRRTVFTPGEQRQWIPTSFKEPGCYDCYRVWYLAEMSGESRQLVQDTIEARTVVAWSDVAALQEAVKRAIQRQQIGVWKLVNRLKVAELGQVHLTVAVEDNRSNRAKALPKISDSRLSLRTASLRE